MATPLNKKFDYCGYQADSSDRDFLGWVYARLNQAFGENPNQEYMKRLEKIVDEMPGKIRVSCDCSVADICPQGKLSHSARCSIWKDNTK